MSRMRSVNDRSLALRNLKIDMAAAIVNGLFLGLVTPYLAAIALRYDGDAWDTAVIAAACRQPAGRAVGQMDATQQTRQACCDVSRRRSVP